MATPSKATKTTPAKSTAGKGAKARDLGRVQAGDVQRRTAAAWRTKVEGIEIEVPSGNVALLRRPGPEMFLRNGAIPDALTPIVEAGIRDKQGLPPEKAAEIAMNAQMLPQVMDMIDSAVVAACIEPVVRPDPTCVRPIEANAEQVCGQSGGAPVHGDKKAAGFHEFIAGDAEPPEGRDPDFLYAAEIGFEDKVFIFQYSLGGSADLERFRAEFEQSMAGVDSVTGGSN